MDKILFIVASALPYVILLSLLVVKLLSIWGVIDAF